MRMEGVMALGTACVASALGDPLPSGSPWWTLRVQVLGWGLDLLFYSLGGVPHNTASNSDKKGSTSTLRQTEKKATS